MAICRHPAAPGPVVLGSQTVRAFGSAYNFGQVTHLEGPWVAPLFTAGFLTYLAIVLWRQGHANGSKAGMLRPMVVFYILITGAVEITRFVWDVSRFALVWAALHNLAEWGIVLFTLFPDSPARQPSQVTRGWWISQLWILLVANWVIFSPSLTDSGLGEELTGLTCDWLLIFVWARLVVLSSTPRPAYLWLGLAGATMHMVEILPLLSLLVGLLPSPWLPGCILVSVTTPITMWLYSRMVTSWEGIQGQEDVVSRPSKHQGRTLAVQSWRTVAGLILGAFALAAFVLFGLIIAFPLCPPGQGIPASTPASSAVMPGASGITGTASGIPAPGHTGTASMPMPTAMSGIGVATNESLCASASKLTGTTTVFAKPGRGQELIDMAATMPGPIRAEPGNRYYELAAGQDEVKYWESWSSLTSLYRHIYTSPTVAAVFRSETFAGLTKNMTLEGPFKAMIPCSEAQAEALPVTIPFSVLLDAPMDVLWKTLGDWTNISWVFGAKHVEMLSDNLRHVTFGDGTIMETRQVSPLPPVEQPEGGHRIIYHVIQGAFLDTIGEAYSGDYSVVPSKEHPGKTVFQYSATITAKHPEATAAFEAYERQDLLTNRLPYLQQFARNAALAALDAQS